MLPLRLLPAAAFACALTLGSCGSAKPEEIYDASRSEYTAGNYAAALQGFEQVIASDVDKKKKFGAMRYALLCEAHTDALSAAHRFEALKQDYTSYLTPEELVNIGTGLAQAQVTDLAVQVVEWGTENHPDSRAQFEKVTQLVAKYGSDEDAEALRKIGYLSGD